MPGGHSKGFRSSTRKLLKRKPRERGKIGLSRILRNYQPGEKIVVQIDSRVQKGMPHRRYHGKTGMIVEKRGRAYVIDVTQKKVMREIIVRPEHLKPHGEDKGA